MTAKELSQRLNERALDACLHLYPNGKQEGFLFKVGSVMGDEGKSLQVNIGGSWAGKWKDWADDAYHGDLLDLWMHAKGINPPETRRQVIEWLGITVPQSIKTYVLPPPNVRSTPLDPSGKVMTYLTAERLLEPAIINRFKVEAKPDTKEIVFPCYSPAGKLINRSYCKLERGPDGKKIIRQDKGAAPCLFGWHAFDDEDWKKGYVVICEGHIDAMTWRQWGHPALSIPNGSGMTWIDYNFEDLECFEKVYVSFDMDGKVDALPLSSRLGASRTAFVSLPHKDANDCLKANPGASSSQEWLDNAKTIRPAHIQTALDLKTPFLRRVMEGDNGVGFASSLFKFFNRDQFKFRPGEVTLWVGISNHGKSTFLRFLFTIFLKSAIPTAIASMEVPSDKTMKSMYIATKGTAELEPETWVNTVGEFVVFYDKIGYADERDLIQAIEYCARRYDVQHFMIDSLMRVSGLEENYPKQGEFMNNLQAVAKKTGVHIHLVAHEGKGADGNPDPDKIKGSSLIRNNADNIFFVKRNMEKRDALREGKITHEEAIGIHDATVYLEKDRETGYSGKVTLTFKKETEQFFPIVQEPKIHGTNGHRPDPYRGKAKALVD